MASFEIKDGPECVGVRQCPFVHLAETMSEQETTFSESSCTEYLDAAYRETGEDVPCGFAAKSIMHLSVEARL